jgi:hypothetical protein
MLLRMFRTSRRVEAAWAATALLALASTPAQAVQAAANVNVTVTFVPSSGVCAAQQAQSGFDVVCDRPSPPLSVDPGRGLHLRSHQPTAPAAMSIANPADFKPAALPYIESAASYNGVEISSWRLVSSHNRTYVELTIAW